MAEPVQIPLPAGGLHTENSFFDQPPGTSRDRLNVRPRDYRAGGLNRAARRPGTEKYANTELGSGNPVRSVEALTYTENNGTSSIVESIATDDFSSRGSDTSVGVLGDFDGDASADWYVFDKATARLTYFDPPTQWTNTYLLGLSWDQTYLSSGTGVFVDDSEEAVVDNRQDGDETGTSAGDGSARIAACYFDPTDTDSVPTDNYAIKLKYTTKSSFTEDGLNSMIGILTNGDRSTPTNDGAFMICIGFRKDSSYGGKAVAEIFCAYNHESYQSTDFSAIGQLNPDSVGLYPLTIAENGIDDLDPDTGQELQLQNVQPIEAATQYTLELRKFGTRIEVYHDGVRYLVIPDYTMRADGGGDDGTTPVDSDNTLTGFVLNSVGAVANGAESVSPFVASIDSYEISDAESDGITQKRRVVAVSNRNIYTGDGDGLSVASGGTGVVGDGSEIRIVPGLGPSSDDSAWYAYILDGMSYYKMNLSNGVVEPWVADNGPTDTLPEGSITGSTKCRHGVIHNAALMLWGNDEDPDLWYMSARFDADDWNYTRVSNPQNSAVKADLSDAGPLPGEIQSIVPWTGRVAVLGTLNQLYGLIGNPNVGGILEVFSINFGFASPYAGAVDDRGFMYGVDFQGLWILAPRSRDPQYLSRNRIDRFFRDIDHTTQTVRLLWSRAHDGLHIFVTPASSTGTIIDHLWWDRRTDTFEKDRFPIEHGPTCATYLAQLGGSEQVLYGGLDGHIRKVVDSAGDDDGQAIEAYMDIGPLVQNGVQEAYLESADVICGENTESLSVTTYAAATPELVAGAANGLTRSVTGGGIKPRMKFEKRGGAVRMRLASKDGSYWSIERFLAQAESVAGYSERSGT